MALTLTIENETSLPDGGPLSVKVSGKRGLDIGRDSHLDWTLPDPTRFISSKHVEIRYRDGGYWLHDVSTNGTFLNGGDHRMQAPHCLRNGDRFTIGHYIIAAAVEGEQGTTPSAAGLAAPQQVAAYQELWATEHEMAPPIDRAQLKAPREQSAPVNPDFLDWAADVPNPFSAPASPAPASTPVPAPRPAPVPRGEDDSWAVGPMSHVPVPPPPVPDIPAPRRPVWTSEPQAPWAGEGGGPPKAEYEAPNVPAFVPMAAELPDAGAGGGVSGAGLQSAPEDFLRRLAQAAGVPEELFSRTDPAELADQLGGVMRLVVDNVMQLLSARVQAKRLTRSSQHTMIQALDNNPLKFSPTAEDALRIMFGPRTRSYLDARRAIEQGFEDLKSHQIKTYSAMQHALTELMAGLEPENISRDTDADRGIAALMASRKAKLWDAYVARWQAQVRREGSGLVDAFMLLFAEHYDRDGK
jgi:type VI secretion system protein ImpI